MAKILIVEDDPFLLSILAEKLKENGFEIESANDGESGLNKIKNGNYDLVLLDIVLPKADGLKVLSELQRDEKFSVAPTPIIVLSNLYDKNNMENAKLAGAKDYLVKAYNTPEMIVVKIKKFLAEDKKIKR